MNARSLLIGLASVLVCVGARAEALQAAQAQPENVLLVGGSLIDGTGAPAVENAWVRLTGDRITGVGQGAPPTIRDARIVDLEGKTVAPGLGDMHVHLGNLETARWVLKLFLAHGVTNVKDTGNSLGNLEAIRRWTEKERSVPHVSMSGYVVQGSYSEQRFLQPGPDTRRPVEEEIAFGVDFIKTYNWTSFRALQQVASLVKGTGVRVTGHTPLSASSIASIDAGIEVLQHLRLRPYEVIDDLEIIARYPTDLALMKRTAFWAHFEPGGRNVEQTLDGWERRKERFFVTPTLVVQEAVAASYDYPDPKLTEDPNLRLLSPGMLARFKKSSPPVHWGELTAEEIAEAKRSFDGMAAFLAQAHSRGIRILSGTDTPVPWLVPGPSLHRELRHFVEKGGMSPEEAIHASTGRVAEALEASDRGTIQEGKVADLIIVDGDVARDIGALARVEKVVLAGRILEREEILQDAAAWAEKDQPEEDDETSP